MPDDITPTPELLASMGSLAGEFDRLATLLDSISQRWRQVANHLRSGALVASIADHLAANRDSDIGSHASAVASDRLRQTLEVQPEYAQYAIRQAAIIDYRAKFALITNVDQIRATIDHHGSVCDDLDCFIMPLLEERLAVLAPH